jgi:putative endonuclease
MFYVYILKCSNGKFYTGSTRGNLDKRIAEHQNGVYAGWTSNYLPVELVFSEIFDNPIAMIEMERKIKGWSHAKKQALIDGDMNKLSILAKKKFKQSLDTQPTAATRDE